MKELEYPFDGEILLRKRKKIRRELLEDGSKRIEKRIAILGGSTTHDIVQILELFLLNAGILPLFYESHYGQYWNDVMFDNSELIAFSPDIVWIHTTCRNIRQFPEITDDIENVQILLQSTYHHYKQLWTNIEEKFHCPIIQNNFQEPFYRLLGNRDAYDIHGRVHFVNELNHLFHEYAAIHENFHICDIHYMASLYGLQKWSDPFYWHMYKYEPAVPAIPEFAYNLSAIIRSIFGKNAKVLALDLDNTLWGGVVGDDGPDNIEIGQETSIGQLFCELQQYIKDIKKIGVLLCIDSKNDEENALAGLLRPDSILKPDDFVSIRANWDSKDRNLQSMAEELNLGVDSFVFMDDNPAERHIVREQLPDVKVLEIGEPQNYLIQLDRNAYFETTSISKDDMNRSEMYQANAARKRKEATFADYGAYLDSLQMVAEIGSFSPVYMSRIAQLTNKSNQFNLTTRRCTQTELERLADDDKNITLYGKLNDCFGDNGVVSVVFGHQEENIFRIDLWLMSCRVLKRDMEFAMMDELVKRCSKRGIKQIYGYYYPTSKNKMVKEFYAMQGFAKVSEDDEGNTVWVLDLTKEYQKKNKHILIREVV